MSYHAWINLYNTDLDVFSWRSNGLLQVTVPKMWESAGDFMSKKHIAMYPIKVELNWLYIYNKLIKKHLITIN